MNSSKYNCKNITFFFLLELQQYWEECEKPKQGLLTENICYPKWSKYSCEDGICNLLYINKLQTFHIETLKIPQDELRFRDVESVGKECVNQRTQNRETFK